MILTSCGGLKTITQEEFMPHYQAVCSSVKEKQVGFENVKIFESGIFGRSYNYKEGEFYAYRYVAIALIIPINQQDYTWIEDGKYYHCEIRVLDKLTYKKEITKEQFDNYMIAHKQTILNQLDEPLDKIDNLLEKDPEEYVSVDNTFSQHSNKDEGYRLSSKAVQSIGDNQTKTTEYNIDFTDTRPTSFETKEEGSNGRTWTYSYGNASFNKPSDSRIDPPAETSQNS